MKILDAFIQASSLVCKDMPPKASMSICYFLFFKPLTPNCTAPPPLQRSLLSRLGSLEVREFFLQTGGEKKKVTAS